MTATLPAALRSPNDDAAVAVLRAYYDPSLESKDAFTGAAFDVWDSTGRGPDAHPNRFTADDLLAVTCLSVHVPPRAAHQLLVTRGTEFEELLGAVGEDRDLAGEDAPLTPASAAWRLEDRLRALPGVGRTTASKLLARKRPRLVPIYDSVVADVLTVRRAHWEPLRLALRADGAALHQRLTGLAAAAQLPPRVSALRVLDVLAWMERRQKAAL